MICPNCKSEIADNSVFCVNCGCKAAEALQNSAENNANETAADPANNAAESNEAINRAVNSLNSAAQPPQNTVQQPVSSFVPDQNTGNAQSSPNMQSPFPAPQQEFVSPPQPKPKKSSKKAVPFIIVGAVAAAAVAVFCCVKFAAADIAHTFMGDEKYAASLGKETLSSLASGNIDSSFSTAFTSMLDTSSGSYYEQYNEYLDNNSDSYLSYSDFTGIRSAGNMLSTVGQILPENGIYAKIGYQAELADKFYKLIAEALGIDKDEVKDVFEACSSFSAEGRISVKEDGVDLGYLISGGGKDLDGGSVYYNTEDGILFYSNPDIYSSPISTKLVPLDIDLSSSYDKSDSLKLAKERKELVQKISDVYGKHIKDAETEYSDATESVGEGEFKGKSMKVTFENEALAELLQDITETILDSKYFESLIESAFDGDVPDYFDIDDLKDEAEEIFDSLAESSVKTSFTIEHFINSDNSPAGLRLSVNVKNDGYKNSAQLMYISAKSDFYAEAKVDGTTYLKCQGTRASARSGSAEITVNIPGSYGSDAQKLKLNVEYSDLGMKELFGSTQILGKLKINLSGNVIDNLSSVNDPVDFASLIKKTTFIVSASDKGSGIKYGFALDNESYGKVSFTAEIGENSADAFDRTNMNEDYAVDMSGSSAETVDVQIGLLEHIKDICTDNEFIGFVMQQSSGYDYLESIQSQIDQLEKNKRYIAVYSDYDPYYTTGTASNIASGIQYNLYSYGTLPLKSKQPVTVKVYYDGNGSMSIIDMAGEDESLLNGIKDMGYRNVYVEILYYKAYNSYAPVGVTAVMTDSKEHHCDSLPTAYNYIDEVYPWSGDSYYIGDYVVGVYPYLYQGTSTYEQTLKDMADKVDVYNQYAEKGFTAFNGYLSSSRNSFDFSTTYSNNEYIVFKIKSGTWSNYGNIYSANFKNDLNTTLLYSYMQTKVPEIKDGYLLIYVSNNVAVGASYCEDSYYISTPLFITGVTSDWGLADGLDSYGNLIGTYPVVRSFDGALSDNVKKLIVGTWTNEYREGDKIQITEDDFKHIVEISEYSAEYISVRFEYENGDSRTYRFNMAGRLSYDWSTYIKNN